MKLDGTQIGDGADPYDNKMTRAIAAARVGDNNVGGQNYAAFRVVGPDGSPFILVGHSDSIHSERLVGITLFDPATGELKAAIRSLTYTPNGDRATGNPVTVQPG